MIAQENEKQALIVGNQPPSLPSLIYDSLDEYFFRLICATGAVERIYTNYGIIVNCNNPEDMECIAKQHNIGLYIAIGATSVKLILKCLKLWLKAKGLCAAFLEKINFVGSILDTFVSILGIHNFYLLCGASIATAIADNPNISNGIFWGGIAAPCILLSLLTSTDIRYKIIEQLCHYSLTNNVQRGIYLKILDSLFTFIESSAFMIGFLSVIEQINDTIHRIPNDSPNSWIWSTGGMAGRYSIGTAYGIFQSILRWHYSPVIKEDEILQNRWPSVIQSTFNVIAFTMLTVFAISQTQMPDFAIMISLCAFLFISGLICAGINMGKPCFQASPQSSPALVIPHNDDNLGGDLNAPSPVADLPTVITHPAPIKSVNLQETSSSNDEHPSAPKTLSTPAPVESFQIGNIARKIMVLFKTEPDKKDTKNSTSISQDSYLEQKAILPTLSVVRQASYAQ